MPSPENVPSRPLNNLLRRLHDKDFALLAPHLQSITVDPQHQLYGAGENVEIVYFPCESTLVSFLVTNSDGRDVDTVLVGREGAVGGIVSQGHLPAYAKISVKFGGPMAKLKVSDLEAAKRKSPSLDNLFARYADCLLAQMLQSTACNAIHSIEQRTAKWILAAMDRADDDILPLTQEQLAFMLGVGRSYASRVLQNFKAENIIDTGRGALVVRNRSALLGRSCNCNDSVKAHFEQVLRGVYPDADAN